MILGTKTLELASADDEIEEREKKASIMQAIYKLPPQYKEVILLFYYQNLSIKDISELLNQAEGTIASRISRARGLLKQELTEL